jgi:hypothetical protein
MKAGGFFGRLGETLYTFNVEIDGVTATSTTATTMVRLSARSPMAAANTVLFLRLWSLLSI